MSGISWDAPLLSMLVLELSETLTGSTVTDIRRTDKNCLWLLTNRGALWFDATPDHSCVALANPPKWRRSDQEWFYTRLRGGNVTDVIWMGGDRVVAVYITKTDRIGTVHNSVLLIELGGRHANLVLVDGDTGAIVDCFRTVSAEKNKHRTLMPGEIYLPPPTFNRHALKELEEIPSADMSLDGWMRQYALAWSKPLIGEIVHRSGAASTTDLCDMGSDQRHNIWKHLSSIIDGPVATICYDERDMVVDLLAFEPTSGHYARWESVPSVSAGLMEVTRAVRQSERYNKQLAELTRKLAKDKSYLERKSKKIKDQVEDGGGAQTLKQTGDLILANQRAIKSGMERVELEDWFSDDSATISVKLNPQKSAVENAQQYYTRARKLRDGLAINKKRLSETEGSLSSVVAALSDLDANLGSDTAVKTVEKLHHDWVSSVNKPQRPRRKGPPEITPRRYITSDGWLVLVGRNDRENDTLSMKVANQNDYWFHTHGSPGSHVVLRRQDKKDEPSKRCIEEAASLAAYWSKQRNAGNVPVIYTLAKYVTKPRGAKPGSVVVKHEKSIMVKPAILPEADAIQVSDSDDTSKRSK